METIKSSREIDAIFRESSRAGNSFLTVLAVPARVMQGGATGRIALVAGRKLGSAVLRNRCKRVLRESVRRCGGPWASWDVVVVARAAAATTPHHTLDQALSSSLRRAGVL